MPATFHHKAENLSMYARSKTVAASLCLVILATTLLFAQAQSKKAPVPDANAQAEATRLIKEVYGDEWSSAKTPAEKQALAKKLLQKAKETDNDQAGRFVLFRLSRDIATQAGDVETAFQAIDEIDRWLGKIDSLEMEGSVLTKCAGTAKIPEQHKLLAEKALALLDHAFAHGQLSSCGANFSACGHLARQRKEEISLVINRASERTTGIEDVAKAYEVAGEQRWQRWRRPSRSPRQIWWWASTSALSKGNGTRGCRCWLSEVTRL